jgi:hypothetical protein
MPKILQLESNLDPETHTPRVQTTQHPEKETKGGSSPQPEPPPAQYEALFQNLLLHPSHLRRSQKLQPIMNHLKNREIDRKIESTQRTKIEAVDRKNWQAGCLVTVGSDPKIDTNRDEYTNT